METMTAPPMNPPSIATPATRVAACAHLAGSRLRGKGTGRALLCWLLGVLCFLPLVASAQTLAINNDIQTYATLASTTVTMTGRSELRITGASSPISGSVIHLNSPDAWFFMTNILPSVVSATYLSQVRVNGALATVNTNCRVVQYGDGTVVIPHASTFAPLQVFMGTHFTGASTSLQNYTAYNDASLGTFANNISSFKLKRGYTATIAQNANGTGISKNYVAQDGDIEVSVLPDALNDTVSFIRVFPWRWVNKKGIAGNIASGLNVRWDYNWNIDRNSTLDVEYVPIRQQRWWPSLTQNWQTVGANHLLGYNEPDSASQANIAVGDAIWSWPDLLGTGLRVGSPAPTDGGLSWLYSFVNQADTAGLRVDFVVVHYYRSYSSASDPVGATTQFYNFLKGVYDQVKRPLWVTEWNNGANWTTGPVPTAAQQQATVAKMIEMLDNTPFVERYSLYNWVEDVRRVKWDDGSLTAAGVTYRDKVSPLSYSQDIPEVPTAPAALYRFEYDARDTSAYGHAAMLKGAAKFTTGKTGQAVVMSGVTADGDHVQLSPRLGDSTDFTFGAWIYWTGASQWQRIFDLGNGTGSYMFLTPLSGSNTLRFEIFKTGTAAQQLNTTQLAANQWVHVAVTISGNTGKLFVNGALVATNTGMTLNPIDLGTSANFLGKGQFSADPLFAGRLDDVQFLPYALTDAKVAAMTTNTPPVFTSGTIAGAAGTQGQPYSGTIAGSATDADAGDTITYSKASGPAWLNVAANGALSGTPGFADEGTQEFIVYATDSVGVAASALLTIQLPSVLGNGTWTADASGNWSETAKWTSSFPANGAGNTANFSTLNITADRTVTLDSSRSIGVMQFGDTSGTQSWTLSAGGGIALTLQTSSGTPTIAVNQNTATLAATLAGTGGFTKSGPGTLVLSGSSTISGTVNIDTGSTTANEGALRAAHPAALSSVTAIAIRANNSGRSTLELDGTLGNVVTSAPIALSARSSTTVPAIRNLAGNNTLSGDITINVGGSSYQFQSDAGTLNLSGTITSSAGGSRTLTFLGSGGISASGVILDGTATVTVFHLTKLDAGTLVLDNANNTFTGNVVISGGTLVAGSSTFFNNGAAPVKGPLGNPQTAGRTVTVNNGGTLVFGRSNVFASTSATVTPAVSLIVNAGGTVKLDAPSPLTPGPGDGDPNVLGNITLNGGTFSTGNGYSSAYQSAILLGTVTVTGTTVSTINSVATNTTSNGLMLGKTGGGTVTFDVSTTGAGGLIVTAPLVNAVNNATGALIKAGAGTMTLAGANTYTGATTINAGKLVVSGTLSSSAITATAGTLAPTGTPATTGSVSIPGGGRFEIAITGPAAGTGYGQLTVGGGVTLAGALDFTASAGLPSGSTFIILNKTSAGAVSGTFAGKPEGSYLAFAGYNWIITYAGGDGNDVALSIATPQQSWRQQYFGTTANTGTAADSFDSNGDGESNLIEFATAQNPTAATTAMPAIEKNGATLELTYTRSLAAMSDGVSFAAEWRDDLGAGTWSSAGVTEQILTDNGTVQTVKASVAAGSGPRFLRLRVTR